LIDEWMAAVTDAVLITLKCGGAYPRGSTGKTLSGRASALPLTGRG